MINLSAEHAEIVRGVLETLLADETNSMGFIDTTSGGAASAADVSEIREEWRQVYEVLCGASLHVAGVQVELLGENGKAWARAVTAGGYEADGAPLVHFLRPDGTPRERTIGWPAKYMRQVK